MYTPFIIDTGDYRRWKLTLLCLLCVYGIQLFAQSDPGQPDTTAGYPEWTEIGNSLSIRSESNTIVYEGEMYCFPGFGFAGAINNSLEKYNPVSNSWTALDTMPLRDDGVTSAGTHYAIVVVDDEVWLMGGRVANHPGRVTDKVYIYNIPTDTWREGPTLPSPTGGGGAGKLGNKIHLVGGFDAQAAYDVDVHWVYDLDEPDLGWQDWTGRSPMPMMRNHFGTVTMRGKLYTVGGQNDHDRRQRGLNGKLMHVYDGVTDTWERLADLPAVQSHSEPGTFVIDGKIYMFGGQERDPQALEYDPATDTWTDMTDFRLPVWLVANSARVFGQQVYVANGGIRTTSYAQSTVRTKDFPRTPLRQLVFNPDSLSLEVNAGDTLLADAILGNLLGEEATRYTLNTDEFPSWLTAHSTTTRVRESNTEINLTIQTAGLIPETYAFVLRASSPGYVAAELPISLTITGNSSEVFARYLEAECALVGDNWLTEAAGAASGNTYVTIQPGFDAKAQPPPAEPANLVTFIVDIPEDAPYHLFARIATGGVNDDSFYVRIDEGPWMKWYRDMITNNAFEWKEVIDSPFDLSPGTHQIDFAYREDGAKLDKLLLTTQADVPAGEGTFADNCQEPPVPTSFELSLEAECGVVGSNWNIESDASASGNSYVIIRPGLDAKQQAPPATPANMLTYVIETPEDSSYHLFARVKTGNVNDDSFYFRIDGGTWQRWWRDLVTGDEFAWKEVIGSPFNLTAGTHLIDFTYREDGAQLDKLLFNLDGAVPIDFGPGESNCGVAQLADHGGQETNSKSGNEVSAPKHFPSSVYPGIISNNSRNVADFPGTEAKLHIYPNPVKELLTLDMINSTDDEVVLQVFDVAGRQFIEKSLVPRKGMQLSVARLPPGSFILRVSGRNSGVNMRRFVVE